MPLFPAAGGGNLPISQKPPPRCREGPEVYYVDHVYAAIGEYTATLTVVAGESEASAMTQVVVRAPPPVIVAVDGHAIVGGAVVVSACDYRLAMTGPWKIGFPELLARHGIERRVYASGAHKSMLDPFRVEQPDDVARLEKLQADIHDHFKSHVYARRADKLAGSDDELFNGDIWSGRQAQALGLIDGIGDLRAVMREKFGERVKLRPMAERRGLFRRRLGLTTAPRGELAAEIIAALEEWATWRRFGL